MSFDPYETWLGIPADRRPPTHYDLLGLTPYESDPATINQAGLRRMRKVREYQLSPHSDLSQEVLAELARARLVLLDADRRADYDAKLRTSGDRPGASIVLPKKVGDGDTPRRSSAPREVAPESLGWLALNEHEIDASSTPHITPNQATSRWKRTVLIGAIAATPAALLGLFFMLMVPRGSSRKTPEYAGTNPAPRPTTPKPKAPVVPQHVPAVTNKPAGTRGRGDGKAYAQPSLSGASKERDGPAGSSQPKPSGADAHAQRSSSMFNGKDLSGWKAFRGEGQISPAEISLIDGGDLVCALDRDKWGRLVTELGYSNFGLVIEYQSSDDHADSGIQLLTASDDPARWSGVECDLRRGSAGSVQATLGLVKGPGRRFDGGYECFSATRAAEAPIGKWNHCEIRCASNRLAVRLNGLEVNQLVSTWPGPWQVALRAQGSRPVRFRNVRMLALEGSGTSVTSVRPPFGAGTVQKAVSKPAQADWEKLVVISPKNPWIVGAIPLGGESCRASYCGGRTGSLSHKRSSIEKW